MSLCTVIESENRYEKFLPTVPLLGELFVNEVTTSLSVTVLKFLLPSLWSIIIIAFGISIYH